jgi:hypothetical protein
MASSSTEKTEICWADDSSGRTTCHLNINGKSLDETYIGEIVFNSEDGKWYSRLKGDPKLHGPHRIYRLAQLHVERSVNGAPVGEEWS